MMCHQWTSASRELSVAIHDEVSTEIESNALKNTHKAKH